MRRFAILTILTLAGTLAFAQKGAPKMSAGERDAIVALQKAQQAGDPDAIIKACDDLITKFADTPFKAFALGMEANVYAQKNDSAKAIVYGEQALEADPNYYDADILLANIYANTTRDNDLDKEEKLKKAEKYANDGIASAIKAVKPNPQLTDAQWDEVKKDAQAQGYQALGTIAMVRKKYDDAMMNYQKGVDIDPDPVIMMRAGRAMLTAKKPAEAIAWFDKAAASPRADAQIKQIAAEDKKRAQASIK